MSPMIEVNGVRRCFGDLVAVDEVSFAVRRGEVLGFLGPNGAGKSTTMRVIAGVLAPDAGSVFLNGASVAEAPLEAARSLGFLPEGAPAWPDLTVRQFLHFIAQIRELYGREGARACERAIEIAQLHGVLEQRVETLSKGYQRRVGLAQAILHEPPALIMDEPTDGLDPNQKRDIRVAIANMAQATAIVISTHILEEVEAVCTRAMIIDKGRMVCDETPAELAARSRYAGALQIVVLTGEVDAAHEALAGLAQTKTVERTPWGSHVRLTVLPTDKSATFFQDASACLQSRSLSPVTMALESGRLDDVFRRLTIGETDSATEAASKKMASEKEGAA